MSSPLSLPHPIYTRGVHQGVQCFGGWQRWGQRGAGIFPTLCGREERTFGEEQLCPPHGWSTLIALVRKPSQTVKLR